MIEALDITVTGIVQGVGFRPFVYRLAKRNLINGWVLNDASGVFIHAEGEAKLLDEFILEISEYAPAAAVVKQIEMREVPLQGCTSFEIRTSDDAAAEETTLVSADLATCDDCLAELFDPGNRRYHYPFINCTNCGPRFTIIDALPYDRPNTSMRDFCMCEPCAAEYADPADRRFHAQPDACFDCGPRLCFTALSGSPALEWAHNVEESDALIARVVEALRAGAIVAVKGLGGFHLVCDAANAEALARLRQRKRRFGKAFAVMVACADAASEYCYVSDEERKLMESPARPIVLLRKRAGVRLAVGLADRLPELGVMLPATPLQHLLVRAFGGMLVFTSGNVHDEPIQTDDAAACEALAGIADYLVGNDRAILSRYDDSVARVLDLGQGQTAIQYLRRARGYSPVPLPFPASGAQVFATGPEQKCTFCFARGNQAFVSQHIGDMENAATYDAWLQAKATYQRLFDLHPTLVACDLHPEYLSSKWARAQELPVTGVQHHHAHIVSVLAENQLDGPAIGFAFDGTGYGVDGALWGGEVLLANTGAFERFANFAYFPLPGGAAAIRDPLRCAYGALWAFDLLEHPGAAPALEQLGEQAQVCEQMIERSLNCPQTSSVGRLFDAASALLGVCVQPTYEGEGAILLEAALYEDSDTEADANDYTFDIVKNTATEHSTARDTSVVLLDAAPAFAALLDDYAAGVPVAQIARRFHDAFVDAIVQLATIMRAAYDINLVALSGGVFMNRYLTQQAVRALAEAGFTVALNQELPPNDANISYGQAVVVSANTAISK